MLPAVFLVLDLEASPNDVVWSVNTTMEKAIESQKRLNDIILKVQKLGVLVMQG